jgi:hypothetical protein
MATTVPLTPTTTRPPHRGGWSPRRQRSALRATHLAVGLLLGTSVYLPVHYEVAEWLRLFLAVLGVPLVTLTGVWMWQQARVRRWWARLR